MMRLIILFLTICLVSVSLSSPFLISEVDNQTAFAQISTSVGSTAGNSTVPAVTDWPQLGYNAQRTNASPVQVDPPYCYIWKWYEAPIAARVQPVVANGRLFVGAGNGIFYARDASTGEPLWHFVVGNPIRHSAAVWQDSVIFTDHLGTTYSLDAASGELRWSRETGASSTAPLVDSDRNLILVVASDGRVSRLNPTNGLLMWQINLGAPVLTSPALSEDGNTIFLGTEDIFAVALNSSNGAELWRTQLQGQSLAERYPVVDGDDLYYRSQPIYSFHQLLREGDDVMNQAGPVLADWESDWAGVRSKIVEYLTDAPAKQTFFALNASSGALRGVAPVLYTYGNNDIPPTPVIGASGVYLPYRPRHGIQTDGGAVHVTTQYDAELGRLDPASLDITGLRQANYPAYQTEFRMTSDENAVLTMSGDLLLVDNWERLGGINVSSGQLVEIGNVSNDWPECGPWIPGTPNTIQCGPGGPNPFFPLSGNAQDPAYPFPAPRVMEGHIRGGVVVAQDMLYWRVAEGGLAALAHQESGSCPAPLVYTETPGAVDVSAAAVVDPVSSNRALADYVLNDLTVPVVYPSSDLVARLQQEVQAIVSSNEHLMPYYLERGFSYPVVWPYDTANPPGPPTIAYQNNGNLFWHDPGEMLYTLAMAYPYLNDDLKVQTQSYVAAALVRYSPLENLPWNSPSRDWLRSGRSRELYAVPMRAELNNWPPPAASLSALYAVWLWSKNSGDWRYAAENWPKAKALFAARKDNVSDYYADLSGIIGYVRLAQYFDDQPALDEGMELALTAMESGQDFARYAEFAVQQYLDPRGYETGWYMPVFYGLTPEVGRFLREQTQGAASSYIVSRQGNDGLRWWYLTRAGAHAEVGETSFVAPSAAWSHFLAQAYIQNADQMSLRSWLDRPWTIGDLYSIQKIVATIHAAPRQAAVTDFVYLPALAR